MQTPVKTGGLIVLALGLWTGAARGQEVERPDWTYFDEELLAGNLEDPMEIDVASDGRVFIAERAGVVRMYDPATGRTREVGRVGVACKMDPPGPLGENWAREDGLLGLALDPGFERTGWVYLYYSVAGEKEVARLSRFELQGDRLDPGTEVPLLEIPSDRGGNTCHMAGCLAFDARGLLYLSTGDNTNPFESDGYAPLDERPGRHFTDAQRTSANTMDLRGKILRIRPRADGGYDIPEGNLFPPGTPRTRPEIYVMGNRNPFRMSIDPRTGYLYWGEVGPDARDAGARGPRGHDELNQARSAGNFGWPFFVGNNLPYADYDFETGEVGEFYEAGRPENRAPRNEGLRVLPAARSPLVYYPYSVSEVFPELGEGGRNAMAGPVYYWEPGAEESGRFPRYYDRTLFMYDWSRGRVWAVRLDEDSQYAGMEPFLDGLSHPMDMEWGPDGALYLLEYGSGWYFNRDGRLRKIRFQGWNRRPIVRLSADPTVGRTPVTVRFSSEGTEDADGDALEYEWSFGESGGVDSREAAPSHTYEVPGAYEVTLAVTDAAGNRSVERLGLALGNARPRVTLEVGDGDGVFRWGRPLAYRVTVTDEEDGSTVDGGIPGDRVRVTAEYHPSGEVPDGGAGDPLLAGMNPLMPGTGLIRGGFCFSCHQVASRSIGPAYEEVAAKYRGDREAVSRLTAKVLQGGVGVWGHTPMPAQAHVGPADARAMVEAILDLGRRDAEVYNGLRGEIPVPAKPDASARAAGVYVVRARYVDNGLPGVGALTGEAVVVLRPEEGGNAARSGNP